MHRRTLLVLTLALTCRVVTPVMAGTQVGDPFRDPNLDAVVRTAVGQPTGELPATALESLINLDGRNCDIADLKGIEHLVGLKILLLSDNQLHDLGPLSALSSLAILDLKGNDLTDLSPLAALTALTHLDLEENGIADLSPLSSLSRLEVLLLDQNHVADLAPLLDLPSLVELSVTGNPLSTVAHLEQIAALKRRGIAIHYDALPGDREGGEDETPMWRPLGPQTAPWSVSVFHLAVAPTDPNLLYAVAQNGLWQSPDLGNTWQRTQLMLPGASGGVLPQVLVGPGDPPALYWADVDLQSPASACLRSTDNGSHWDSIATPLGDGRCDYVSERPISPLIAADPLIPGQLYGWRCSSMMRSSDGGTAWQPVHQANSNPLYLDSGSPFLLTHPSAQSVRYAGGTTLSLRTFLARSNDMGMTWADRHELPRGLTALALDPVAEGHWLALAADTVLASADDGITWRAAGLVPEEDLAGLLAVVEEEPSALGTQRSIWYAWRLRSYWTGEEPAWRSADSGQHWLPINLSGISQLLAIPTRPGTLLAVAAPQNWAGRAYISVDSGRTWRPLAPTEQQQPAASVLSDGNGNLWVGGARWDGALAVPALWRSADRGSHWEEHAAPGIEAKSMIEMLGRGPLDRLMLDPAIPGMLWAHTGTRFLASRDSGQTWQVALDASRDLRGSDLTRADIVRATGRDGALYLLEPGGRLFRGTQPEGPWREVDLAGLGTDALLGLRAITWVPTGEGRLYVGKGYTGEVWWSEDGAESWTRAGRLPGGDPALTLACPPGCASRIYAANALGLSLSTDRGRTWKLVFEARNQVWPQVRLAFQQNDSDAVTFATGRHLYSSGDAGVTWQSLGASGECQMWFSDVATDPRDPSLLYGATPWGVQVLDRDAAETVVVDVPGARPPICLLRACYPNPFNACTTIQYELPARQYVSLTIYDVLGKRIRTLAAGEQEAGAYRQVWDGRDDRRQAVGSGVYVARLVADGQMRTRRLVLVR